VYRPQTGSVETLKTENFQCKFTKFTKQHSLCTSLRHAASLSEMTRTIRRPRKEAIRKKITWKLVHRHTGCAVYTEDVKQFPAYAWAIAVKWTTHIRPDGTPMKKTTKLYESEDNDDEQCDCEVCDPPSPLYNKQGKRGCDINCRGACYMCEPGFL
jgi:hypothetical protein